MTIACFGELLVRLSTPDRQLLVQTRSLDLHIGGAEANVAIGLANLGHHVRMISRVADNPLGQMALQNLRAAGVDCEGVKVAGGRMGLYFLAPGAGPRPSEIVYDRASSSFALAAADDFDWDRLLAGVDHLHISGITPALGARSAEAALAAGRTARQRGIPLSFDGNYRARLWECWNGDPRAILSEFVAMADIFFGNHRDMSLLLGRQFPGDGEARRREAAEAGFAAFPNLQLIASTARHVEDADRHRIAARVDRRDEAVQTEEVAVSGIIDRIGAGDAFAAGVLHGKLTGQDATGMARSGLALACLKHSQPGDASLFGVRDMDVFWNGNRDVRR